jgi:hypothetical protein
MPVRLRGRHLGKKIEWHGHGVKEGIALRADVVVTYGHGRGTSGDMTYHFSVKGGFGSVTAA